MWRHFLGGNPDGQLIDVDDGAIAPYRGTAMCSPDQDPKFGGFARVVRPATGRQR